MFCLIGMGKVANKNIPQLLMDHGKYPKITKKLLRFAPTNNENYGPNPRHFFCQKGCEELKTTSDRSFHKIFSFSENVFPPSDKYRFFVCRPKIFREHQWLTIPYTQSSPQNLRTCRSSGTSPGTFTHRRLRSAQSEMRIPGSAGNETSDLDGVVEKGCGVVYTSV